ncbi:MAG: radical SAM protein [Candidatus Thiodiazotropha sp. (ex Epidulcina cf. delphinae)]|nr:radical SAM protein [Candidatus Thiodiazotropha sp. (ex Epidulcina cf. delphinae)]
MNLELPLDRPPPGFDPADIQASPWQEHDRPVMALALDLAGRCNIACRYCAESASQPHHRPFMSPDTLAKAWDWLIPDGIPRQGSSIRLGSGEPLLAMPLLQDLADRLERLRQAGQVPPEVFLTTNGTLADAEVRDWLVSKGWHVKISLDGPQAIHDQWRVTAAGRGTHGQVAEAVEALAKRMPDRFSVTAVLCRGNDPQAVFDGISSLGVRRIELVPVVHSDPNILPDGKDLARYRAFTEAWVDDWLATPEGTEPAELVRLTNAARRTMGYDVKRVVCGAGRNFFGVGPEGDIYPCFRFVGLPEYRLGNIASGPDGASLKAFRQGVGRTYEQRPDCRNCWSAPLCGGPCFSCAELFGSGGGAPFALHCDFMRADAHAAVRLVNGLRERSPERLLALLAGLVDLHVEA